MSDFETAFQNVWSTAAIATAVIGGLVVGVLIARLARVPVNENARRTAVIVALAASLFAAVFWVGQLTEAIADGDAAWPRALARAILQLAYALFTGVGFYIGVRLERRG